MCTRDVDAEAACLFFSEVGFWQHGKKELFFFCALVKQSQKLLTFLFNISKKLLVTIVIVS